MISPANTVQRPETNPVSFPKVNMKGRRQEGGEFAKKLIELNRDSYVDAQRGVDIYA